MEKVKVIALIAFLLLVAIIFFYPKTNNIWTDEFTARTNQYKNMDCTCLGFAKIKSGLTRSDIIEKQCFGLPINCKDSCKKIVYGNWTNISCDKLEVGK